MKGKEPKAGREKEPYKNIRGRYKEPDALTEEQADAVCRIEEALSSGCLLYTSRCV